MKSSLLITMLSLRKSLVVICAVGYWLVLTPAHALLPQAVDGEPLPSLAPMLENVLPTVVNISTTTRIRDDSNPLMRDPFFREFFPRRERKSSSLGSGVIVDAENGYIITNHHVIDQAEKITATTKDGRVLEATLVGSDAATDVAVIQVEERDIVALKLGRSDALRVGDFVVAIGSPFGLSQTVTSGIVSALGRSGLGIEGYEDFIQTDASINPGNSGGALVNLRGELIGINTAILSRGGGSVGIGLSIPIDMVNTLMQQLVTFGNVERGLLGVAMQDLTPQLADAFGLKGKKGAIVSEVVPGFAAEEVDMQSGDVIVQFNDEVIESSADLRNAVGLLRAGDQGVVHFFRDGERISKEVVIKSAEDVASAAQQLSANNRFNGVTLENVTSPNGRERGVRIVSISEDSPAEETGLEPGDIILSLNKRDVESVEEFTAITENASGVVLIRLIRDGRPLVLVIQ